MSLFSCVYLPWYLLGSGGSFVPFLFGSWILKNTLIFLIIVDAWPCTPPHVCGDRRTTSWSSFSPSVVGGVPRIQLRSSASRQAFYMLNHPAGPGILYVHAVCKSAPTILKQVFSNSLLSFLVSALTSSYFWPFYSVAHFMISVDNSLACHSLIH